MDHAVSILKDVITAIAAVWGAALSTYLYLDLKRNRRAREIVGVSSKVFPGHIEIRTINSGREAVFIKEPILYVKTFFRKAIEIRPEFDNIFDNYPVTLQSGEDCLHRIDNEFISRALHDRKKNNRVWLTPICETSAGTTFKGMPFSFDPNR